MSRYKRYLFSDAPVPKSTHYRHKNAPLMFRKRKKDGVTERQAELHNNLTSQLGEPTSSAGSEMRNNAIENHDKDRSENEDDPDCESDPDCNDSLPSDNIMYSSSLQACTELEVEENEDRIIQSGKYSDPDCESDPDCNDSLPSDNIMYSSNLQACFELDVEENEDRIIQSGKYSKQDDKDNLSEQLCQCTEATSGDVLLQCLTLGLRHNLSWVAQVDILKMVNCLFGREVVPATKYKFLKHVERGRPTYHIFCPLCESYLGRKEDLPDYKMCNCGTKVQVLTTPSFFLSVDLESQVKELLENPDVVKALLTYRFKRKKINDCAFEDIFDGSEYQKFFKNGGILCNPYNFSYCFNTDGIPMGKSSNKTVWPIYLTINELSPRDRGKYVLLAGLYVGCKDPNQKAFLEPFVEQANFLSTSGIDWCHNDKKVNSKLIPICCIVDSVARWQILNMSSFTARNGCTFCYQETERSTRGQRFSILTTTPAVLRTTESTIRDSLETIQGDSDRGGDQTNKRRRRAVTCNIVRGVKGPSTLMLLKYFSLIDGFCPDYMHLILLGCVKTYTELILESTRKNFWVDMDDSVGVEHLYTTIDDRLTRIQPPKSITRLPRSLKDWKLWKASEWRSWLIFYCLPCLQGLLKRKHLEHLGLLSMGCNIILQKSITENDISFAHNLFIKYACLFQKYFGLEEMVYNVHLLTHISKGLLSFGPAWTHNAFIYEGQNRYLLQLYQSPSHVALQIVRKFLTFNALPTLCKQLSASDRTLKYCDTVLDTRKLRFYVRCNGVILLGSGKKCTLSDEERDVLLAKRNVSLNDIMQYDKLLFGRVRYTVFDYSCLHKNNDAFIWLRNNNVVRIEKILKPCNCDVVLIGREVFIDNSFKMDKCHGFAISHIQKVLRLGHLNVFTVEDIAAQCVFMHVHNEDFICKLPYGCYGD